VKNRQLLPLRKRAVPLILNSVLEIGDSFTVSKDIYIRFLMFSVTATFISIDFLPSSIINLYKLV
jgi:hypothetical protein